MLVCPACMSACPDGAPCCCGRASGGAYVHCTSCAYVAHISCQRQHCGWRVAWRRGRWAWQVSFAMPRTHALSRTVTCMHLSKVAVPVLPSDSGIPHSARVLSMLGYCTCIPKLIYGFLRACLDAQPGAASLPVITSGRCERSAAARMSPTADAALLAMLAALGWACAGCEGHGGYALWQAAAERASGQHALDVSGKCSPRIGRCRARCAPQLSACLAAAAWRPWRG